MCSCVLQHRLLGTVDWEAKTPRNVSEIEAQSTLIRNRMQNYRGSPASSLDEQVKQLSKGAQQIAHYMVLMQKEIGRLRDAVEASTKRKIHKRRYIQAEETLAVGDYRQSFLKRLLKFVGRLTNHSLQTGETHPASHC